MNNGDGVLALCLAAGGINVYHAATTHGDTFSSAAGAFLYGGVLLVIAAMNYQLGFVLAVLYLITSFSLNGMSLLSAANNVTKKP